MLFTIFKKILAIFLMLFTTDAGKLLLTVTIFTIIYFIIEGAVKTRLARFKRKR